MKNKIIILVILMLTSIILTSCYNYHDIDDAIYVTCLIIDIDDNKNPIIFVETFKPIGGDDSNSQSGTRILFKESGKTLFEAMRTLGLAASYKLNYTQNKAIIFTEKAAEYGLDNFVDFLDRDQELLIRAFICVSREAPEKLLSAKFKENKYMGIFVVKMLDNIGSSSRAVEMSLNDYMKQRLIGDKTNVVPLIELKEDRIGDDKIEIIGGVVIKEDKMVEIIKRTEGQGFNFLLNNIKSGTLEPENPEVPGKFLTLEILKSKTKTKIEYYGEEVELFKTINVSTALGEIQGNMEINDKNINKIRETTEKNIEKSCMTVFETYKEKGIDIFDIKEVFYRKYPHDEIEDIIKKTNLNLEVNVEVNYYNEVQDLKKS